MRVKQPNPFTSPLTDWWEKHLSFEALDSPEVNDELTKREVERERLLGDEEVDKELDILYGNNGEEVTEIDESLYDDEDRISDLAKAEYYHNKYGDDR